MACNIEVLDGSHIRKLLHSNRLLILLEIILVLAPTQVILVLGYRPERDYIPIGDDLVILGGLPVYVGMILTLLLFWVVTKIRDASWQTFGISRRVNWLRAILSGVGLTIIMIVVIVILQEILMLAFPDAVPSDLSHFSALYHNLPNLILNVIVMWIAAGFVEELIWRGYLMNRLSGVFGKSRIALGATLFCSAALFSVTHFYQGPSGMLLNGATGLLIGAAFLLVLRNLWPLVIAHGLINTISFVDMFLNGI